MIDTFRYIFELFLKIYKPDFNIDINYGKNNASKIQINRAKLDNFKNINLSDIKTVVYKEWGDKKIPFFFDSKETDIITQKDDSVIINYDIIASSFLLLSGYQEYLIKNRDEYGRFPYEHSLQNKYDFTLLPIVNYYFDILKTAIENAYNVSLKIKLWDDKDFAVFVSHDIDLCETAWKEGSSWRLKRGDIITPFNLVFKKIFRNDAWFNFDDILEIENLLQIPSTYFFINQSSKKGKMKNGDYNIFDKKFLKVFQNIKNQGSEIAIHGSLGTHNNTKKFLNEINLMPTHVEGNRFHYMFYDIDSTPENMEESGLKYDSTAGFAETIGFRSSFCLPYYLFDFQSNKPTSVLEIPLTFMDSSLRQNYMNLSKESIINYAKNIIGEIKKHHGIFSINWHNNRFSDVKEPGWKDIFIEIIKLCKSENALFLTGKEIANKFMQQYN